MGNYFPTPMKFNLRPMQWTPHPPELPTFGMKGTFDSNEVTGSVFGATCMPLDLERDAAESAQMQTTGGGGGIPLVLGVPGVLRWRPDKCGGPVRQARPASHRFHQLKIVETGWTGPKAIAPGNWTGEPTG